MRRNRSYAPGRIDLRTTYSRRDFCRLSAKAVGIVAATVLVDTSLAGPLYASNRIANRFRRNYAGHFMLSNQYLGVLIYQIHKARGMYPGEDFLLTFHYDQSAATGVIPSPIAGITQQGDDWLFSYDTAAGSGVIQRPISSIAIAGSNLSFQYDQSATTGVLPAPVDSISLQGGALQFNYDSTAAPGVIPRLLSSIDADNMVLRFNYDQTANPGVIPPRVESISMEDSSYRFSYAPATGTIPSPLASISRRGSTLRFNYDETVGPGVIPRPVERIEIEVKSRLEL